METLKMIIVLVVIAVAAVVLIRSVYSCLTAHYNWSAKTNLVVSVTLFSVTCLLAAAAIVAIILQVSLVVAAI